MGPAVVHRRAGFKLVSLKEVFTVLSSTLKRYKLLVVVSKSHYVTNKYIESTETRPFTYHYLCLL